MNRTSLEFARVGILSAMVTAGVLLPAKLVQKRAALPAAPAQNEKLQVQEVGPQELVATIGIAVNDKNEVVGTAFGDNDEVRAFIVRNGKGELLPLPNGAPLSAASGINDKGEAVGIAGSENSLRGVVWAGGKAGVLTSGKRDTVATTLSRQSVAAGIAMDAQRSENYFASHLAMISSEFAAQLPRIQDNGFSGMLWSKPGDGKAIGEFIPQSGSPSGILVGLTPARMALSPLLSRVARSAPSPYPVASKWRFPWRPTTRRSLSEPVSPKTARSSPWAGAMVRRASCPYRGISKGWH